LTHELFHSFRDWGKGFIWFRSASNFLTRFLNEEMAFALEIIVSTLLLAVMAWAQDTSGQASPDVPDVLFKDQTRTASGAMDLNELRSYLQAQRWREAKPLADRLVNSQPQEPLAHFYLGYILLRQHDNLPAIRSLRKAERLGLKDPDLAKTLGLAYYAINQFLLFEQQMRKGIEEAPNDPWPHYYLGLYETTVTENFGEALSHFEKALNLRPDDPKILYYRGFCHEMLDQSELAEKDYEEAIQRLVSLSGPFSWPYQGLARLLAKTNPAGALHYAQLAVEKEAGVANNHVVLAKIYEELGRPQEAIEALKAAARADATQAAPHYQLYRLLSKQGNQKAAEGELGEFQKLRTLYGS